MLVPTAGTTLFITGFGACNSRGFGNLCLASQVGGVRPDIRPSTPDICKLGELNVKGWRYYFFRVLLCVCIALIATVLLAFLGLRSFFWQSDRDCAENSQTVRQENGNIEAVIRVKCCDWIAGGCTETILLRKRDGTGSETKIFVYDPTILIYGGDELSHDPILTWLGPNELEIAVDRVGEIHFQKTESRGVNIVYRIGIVENP